MEFKYTVTYYEQLTNKLYSAVISDILDEMGHRNQTMSTELRPLSGDMVLAGRAKTVLASDVGRIPQEPYRKQIEALDSMQEGEIFVASVGGSDRSAFFGELMATAAWKKGGRGAIVHGLVRDAKQIIRMGFPLFCSGFRPTDSLGRNEVFEYDTTIECGGVIVKPGDLIFGDIDGIVVVPSDIEDQVIARALEKSSQENTVRDAISNGMSVKDAFFKYGVL
jgi:4-hydroxy-4-methyl-2-oxoglutarate aldolase